MWRVIKLLFYLAVLAGIGLVGFAYIGPLLSPDRFDAPTREIREPVTLDPGE